MCSISGGERDASAIASTDGSSLIKFLIAGGYMQSIGCT